MASKRKQRRKQCSGKKPYCNEQHARFEAGKKRRQTADDIQAYCCGNCGWWHIGHRSARKLGLV